MHIHIMWMWKKNCVECMGNVQHSFLAWFSAKMPLFEIFALAIEINDTIKKKQQLPLVDEFGLNLTLK